MIPCPGASRNAPESRPTRFTPPVAHLPPKPLLPRRNPTMRTRYLIGVVEGIARVDLSFPVRDINDLLKSMVVRDLDGGHVTTVSYNSNAPVEKTLSSFALNLTGNPSLAALLNQARGEKVEAATAAGTCL